MISRSEKEINVIPTYKNYFNPNSADILPNRKETRQLCPSPLFLFNILLKVLANAVRPEKTIKVIRREEAKQSIFMDDNYLQKKKIIIYQKSLELISKFIKIEVYINECRSV